MSQQVCAVAFRLDDDRIKCAVELLDLPGAAPVLNPMPAIELTGATPEPGAFVVLASKAGVELLDEVGWNPGDAVLCCIGPMTADAVRDTGWTVDHVPDEYTPVGLVDHLMPNVDGATVEITRNDYGSAVLTGGLCDVDADVHETVLYRLVRPEGAGEPVELAAAGDLEAALFTSSLMVEHFPDVAAEHGIHEETTAGLNGAVVGAIGPLTRDTVGSHGIDVAIVPGEATLEVLTVTTVETATSTYHE